MGYKWLLSRFDGRIGRARYWLATLIIMGAMVSGLRLLSSACDMLGIVPGTLNIDLIGISASIEPADGDVATEAGLFPRIATVLMALVFAWFYAAASIRRLHDRNKSGWWVVPFLVATKNNVDSAPKQLAARAGNFNPRGGHLLHLPLPARDARVQPVRGRSAGAGQSRPSGRSALGPAERARICAAQRWPIAGSPC